MKLRVNGLTLPYLCSSRVISHGKRLYAKQQWSKIECIVMYKANYLEPENT